MRCFKQGLFCFAILLFPGLSSAADAPAFDVKLDDKALDWIASQIFHNECAGKLSCLVHWNEGEAFPSLGIGHFIWYPTGIDGPFVESFPAMIEYLSAAGASLPESLSDLEPFNAPWIDREEFIRTSDTDKVNNLRGFLARTTSLQAGFMVQRAKEALGRVVLAAPGPEQGVISDRIAALLATPGGTYALIDYVNFKGEGLVDSERYKGKGWGLLQVLQTMKSSQHHSTLQAFRDSAEEVLTRRAENAQQRIEKERWLPGWLNRIDTYREPE